MDLKETQNLSILLERLRNFYTDNELIDLFLDNFSPDFLHKLNKELIARHNSIDEQLHVVLMGIILEFLQLYMPVNSKNVFDLLYGRSRKREIVYARKFYFWYWYFRSCDSMELVAGSLNRDHSTVIHSLKTYYSGVINKFPEFKILQKKVDRFGFKINELIPSKTETFKTVTGHNNYVIIENEKISLKNISLNMGAEK